VEKPGQKNFEALLVEAAALTGIGLEQKESEAFYVYAKELLEWNRKINLTAITEIDDIIIKHFVDSLSVIRNRSLFGLIADIGSGAGFPGIPLKIKMPELEIVLIESIRKKASFLNHIIRVLGLRGISVYNGRVEDFNPREGFDFVLSRAFSSLQGCLDVSLPILKKGGCVIAMRGKDGAREMSATNTLKDSSVESFSLPFDRGIRNLVVVMKG